jgi:predicted RNase H-like HicB family nuclease
MDTNRNYTIQVTPDEQGGFTATVVELGVTVTGADQFKALEAAHKAISDTIRAKLEAVERRRKERQIA